jgi:hypothetical protein
MSKSESMSGMYDVKGMRMELVNLGYVSLNKTHKKNSEKKESKIVTITFLRSRVLFVHRRPLYVLPGSPYASNDTHGPADVKAVTMADS